MNVGLGLPNAVPGVEPEVIIRWAQHADSGPFSSVGVVDRVRYECYEPMTTLAAVAAATRRVGLVTMVVVGPLRNGAVLGRMAATIDGISNGRLTLGLAVGARAEDYEALGMSARARGERLAEQLAGLRSGVGGSGPKPGDGRSSGPTLLLGGMSDVTYARVGRYADGYVHGGGPPRTFERAADRVRTAWAEMARPGKPRLWAQGYFALGDDAGERGRAYMLDYYAFTGPFATRIAEGLLTTPQSVVQFVRGYQEAGCHELVLFPAVADFDQLERLAAVLSGG